MKMTKALFVLAALTALVLLCSPAYAGGGIRIGVGIGIPLGGPVYAPYPYYPPYPYVRALPLLRAVSRLSCPGVCRSATIHGVRTACPYRATGLLSASADLIIDSDDGPALSDAAAATGSFGIVWAGGSADSAARLPVIACSAAPTPSSQPSGSPSSSYYQPPAQVQPSAPLAAPELLPPPPSAPASSANPLRGN